MSISDSLTRKLKEIAGRMDGAVEVGFLEGATYPTGEPVAAIAFFQEFGTSNIPSRPFFRRMIATEKPTWADKVRAAYQHTGGDVEKTLALMGNDIEGALKQSINDLTSPPLAPYTIKKKGFSKPLIDTSHMINSTGYRVIK